MLGFETTTDLLTRWRRALAMRIIVALLGPMLVISSVLPVSAEWPERPIQIVVPFQAPGASDTMIRIIADAIKEDLKQPVVIENRGGAAGTIGSSQVARAAPDGYTLLVSGVGSHVIAPMTMQNPGFEPLADFTHIAYLGGGPVVWVTGLNSDIKSIDDVVRRAKDGKPIGYASPGRGTLASLTAEFVAKNAGIQLTNIPYNSAVMTDVIAGRVPFGITGWSSVIGQIAGGTLRPLAVTSEERMPGFPDIPTFKELGYDLTTLAWFALSGPKGMRPEVVERINIAVIRAMSKPDVKIKLDQLSVVFKTMSPPELTALFRSEIEFWRPIINAAGLAAEAPAKQ